MQADQTLNVSKKVDGKPSLERVNGRGVCGFKTMPPAATTAWLQHSQRHESNPSMRHSTWSLLKGVCTVAL